MKIPLRPEVHLAVDCLLRVRSARLAESEDEDFQDALADESEILWDQLTHEERDFIWGVSTDLHLLEGDEIVLPWSGTPREFRTRLKEALNDDSPLNALAVLRQRGGAGDRDFRVLRRRARLYHDLGLGGVATIFVPNVRFRRKRQNTVAHQLPA